MASPVAGDTKIVIADGFMPNVQFMPYYVVIDKGYYAAAGFDVTMRSSLESRSAACWRNRVRSI
jgi:ABC-type nitrate/sulfonate/bicarbonate transport system substrate-binding protein